MKTIRLGLPVSLTLLLLLSGGVVTASGPQVIAYVDTAQTAADIELKEREPLDTILDDARESMAKAVEAFKRDLAKMLAGPASLTMLDGVQVSYYGTLTPLTDVAALTVVDPQLITIKPYEKTLLTDIEKALVASNLGFTPSNDGEIIRLPIPRMSGDRRQQMVKVLKSQTEDARVSVRSIGRDVTARIKAVEGINEDALHHRLKAAQDLTDEYIAQVDKAAGDKEKDIMKD